ncbi:MAG TPA: tetratricopeptide repeat protein [Pyrinomonadaceae bacterium]|jgi:tetratricopeptide (TPR) repeat protein
MIDWLRVLLEMFYAPGRALREVRDRAPLGLALLVAFISQLAYVLAVQWLAHNRTLGINGALASLPLIFQAASSLLIVAIVFVPVLILIANLFERRGSFALVLQQEYASLASAILCGWAAANLLTLALAFLAHFSGFQAVYVASSIESSAQWQPVFRNWLPPEDLAKFSDPAFHAANLFSSIKKIVFTVWTILAVREVFRFSIGRSLAVLFSSLFVMLVTAPVWAILFTTVLASPFWLILLFLLLRGYMGEVTRAHRARAAFKQNLEAATLNPADASAHYNLGLIHLQRGELDQARTRFERAIEIDPEETDSYFQLGRIARAEGRLPDAIKHFEQVVTRDQSHALYEIWREIGATYIAAGQFEDARDALERFLEHRSLDPEGLYLLGRAHAGLGHQREAADAMQACIEAVKTAPAYKYRTEKRWLNEARQFIKSSQ